MSREEVRRRVSPCSGYPVYATWAQIVLYWDMMILYAWQENSQPRTHIKFLLKLKPLRFQFWQLVVTTGAVLYYWSQNSQGQPTLFEQPLWQKYNRGSLCIFLQWSQTNSCCFDKQISQLLCPFHEAVFKKDYLTKIYHVLYCFAKYFCEMIPAMLTAMIHWWYISCGCFTMKAINL